MLSFAPTTHYSPPQPNWVPISLNFCEMGFHSLLNLTPITHPAGTQIIEISSNKPNFFLEIIAGSVV
jgi:hypothetical protein